MINKSKIINDPVYGFLTIPSELIFNLIQDPIFQRLRRIRQLGMSELVYPGAVHSRFHHALGALNLMIKAVEVLRIKKIKISEQEAQALYVAILLHDIGHGPYSHTLEHNIINGVHHEFISLMLMNSLNKKYKNELTLSIQIFKNQYKRKFFHQLISSQLDMDRLDYLSRDSFYTGVSEGVIGAERIIHMLNVINDELVVEEKGIYSIEKFIIARRLMYWQVYLHKTVVAADVLIGNILKRAKLVSEIDKNIFCSPSLKWFLTKKINQNKFENDTVSIKNFIQLDDNDILSAIKVWQFHPDKILSFLSKCLIERKLPKTKILNKPINLEELKKFKINVCKKHNLENEFADYLLECKTVSNDAYKDDHSAIKILAKNGEIKELAEVSDNYNLKALKNTVKKVYLIEM